MIVFQHAAEALAALDRSAALSASRLHDDQAIAQALVVPFVMVVLAKLMKGPSQGAFTEQNEALQARFLKGSD
ncbi:MAG TPA: hypothetical protein VIX19_02410, partial [Terriglobales bacterium]